MLTVRIALGRWIFDLDFGPRPDDELIEVQVDELPFGFSQPAVE